MLTRKLREIKARRDGGEGGFTLIELLVVIIIIGILASIAIPIFMNQQKTARDAATTSDVKNLATNVQTGLVKFPDANYFTIADAAPVAATAAAPAALGATATVTDADGNGKVTVYVGNSANSTTPAAAGSWEAYEVTVSKGTALRIESTTAGTFVVKGFNANGKSYSDLAGALTYNSAAGGIR